MGFTKQQQDVIEQRASNLAVFAAPGSGKTTVLNAHILFQLTHTSISPSGILAVTFTKESAIDLKSRLANRLHHRKHMLESLRIGTFHAQVFRMMVHITPNIPVVMSPAEQRQFLMRAVQTEGLSCTRGEVDEWSNAISKLKSTWTDARVSRRVKSVHTRYERLKKDHGRWDFDDILFEFCRRIYDDESVLEFIPTIEYILVDEFQDTNAIQWAILQRMTTIMQIPLFVVGDDDQCIYTFRGASPQYLIDFCANVPQATQFQLTHNFRSDRLIVDYASRVIDNNQNRFPKEWAVVNHEAGQCYCKIWPSEKRESAEVAYFIEQQFQDGNSQSIAVLARTRRQLYLLLNQLPRAIQGAVDFHTFHDAKGREWDVVVIIGAVRVNPYLRSSETADVEEERRLFYVAMTRARHHLMINVPLRMNSLKMEPSLFVGEARLL